MAESESLLIIEAPGQTARARREREPRVLADIIASQLESLKTHHQAVLETADVEAIHKMRVTTRRLQASLDLIGSERKMQRLKNELRGWRRRLSRVRNYDVFLMLLETEAQARRGAHREQFELIMTKLEERRARRAEQVRGYLEKVDVNRIAKKLGLSLSPAAESAEEIASDNAEQVDREPTETADVAAREQEPATVSGKGLQLDQSKFAAHAADRLERRLAEFQALAAAAHATTDPAELHQLRIAAKRVRYILEIVTDMGYGQPVSALRWLRTLQDRIGDWHDLHALEEEIIKIVSRPNFLHEHLAESSRMLEAAAHLQRKKEALVTKLFPVRVPRTLVVTSNRIVRVLRRQTSFKPTATKKSI